MILMDQPIIGIAKDTWHDNCCHFRSGGAPPEEQQPAPDDMDDVEKAQYQ